MCLPETNEACTLATAAAVHLVAEREGVAKLRMLYVEPSARGLGIGRRLVQEVTRFARLERNALRAARRLHRAGLVITLEPYDEASRPARAKSRSIAK
ncbi:MAG: GNAT family N-acetyltransferase [Gemmatimonadaceae bacterium]